ncbi:MAG: hypothetical protein ACM3N4_10770 [Nitrososphaerota archaeon]
MREFERTRRDSAGTNPTGQPFPEDFSLDEAAFASELRELFPLEQEVLPPHFIQTVIEDEWHSSTPPGFEQKLTYDVFSRLSLPRGPLFRQQRTPWDNIRQAFGRTTRPLAASLVAVALLMIFSVIVSSPSFAAGMQLLLAHTGVQQVSHYPSNVRTATPTHSPYKPMSLTSTIPVSWLGPTAGEYRFVGARAMPAESWSNGTITELQYAIPHKTPGTGVLDIREFEVSPDLAAVWQIVQADSAVGLTIDGMPAVYVDGIWMDRSARQQPMMDSRVWKFGVRSELMFERDGIVYWIVGDQRDGANMDELVKLARMLTVTNSRILHPNPITLHALGESFMQVFQEPQGIELYRLVPRGAALTSDTGILVPSDDLPY